jgi:hypothetical protein
LKKERAVEERAVVGLDLSEKASAAVWLPARWQPGDWRSIVAETFDAEAEQEAGGYRRIYVVACAVRGFVEAVWRRDPHRFPAVFVEQYGFSYGSSRAVTGLAELGGSVRFTLRERHKAAVHPLVASSARKLLFGPQRRMARKEWKALVAVELGRMGCPLDDEDQRDAFVVANAARHALGLPCLAHGD